MIARQRDAKRLNEIVNHESVKPHLQFLSDGPIDLSDLVRDPANYLLMGEHGGVLFIRLQNGLYEAHTQVLPQGRGTGVLDLARLAQQWMFTRTDALELVSKCPTLRTKALAKCVNGRLDCTVTGHDGKPVDVYRVTIQNWMAGARDLENIGARCAALLDLADYGPMLHRPLGIAAEMFRRNQPVKAVIFFNRWAMLAGHPPMSIVSTTTPSFKVADNIIVVRENGTVYAALGTKH